MVIGIDHGNSQIKTEHQTFTSGITEHNSVRPALPTDVVMYEGNYYTIKGERDEYRRDKTVDEKCFIATLFAIAREIMATGQYSSGQMDVDLAIGLPPEHFSKQRGTFEKYFRDHGNIWSFTYNDKPFEIKLNGIYTMPQAYAAIATRGSLLKEYSSMCMIDIGGYTVDILLMENNKPNLSYCYSLDLGIIVMNNNISHNINAEKGFSINDNLITDVLMGKKTILSEEVIDFIKDEARKHTSKILNNLIERKINFNTTPAVFLGGGSIILKDYILQTGIVNERTAEFIPEISANAQGYAAIATSLIRKSKKMESI